MSEQWVYYYGNKDGTRTYYGYKQTSGNKLQLYASWCGYDSSKHTFLYWKCTGGWTGTSYVLNPTTSGVTGTEYWTCYYTTKTTSYTVSVNAKTGCSVSPSGNVSVSSGGSLKMYCYPSTGYTFAYWEYSTDGGSTWNKSYVQNPTTSNVTSNEIWNAYCTQTKYNYYLRYNNNGGSGTPSTQSYTDTTNTSHTFYVTQEQPTKTGCTFKGWSFDSSATSADYSAGDAVTLYSSNADRTLYAVWEKITYNLTVENDGNGLTTPSGTTSITAGDSVTLTGYGNTGYEFNYWEYYHTSGTVYTSTDNPYTISSMSESLVFKAHFQRVSTEFILSYDANGGGGAPSSQSYSDRVASYTFTITSQVPTRTGYEFKGWSFDSSATSADYQPGDEVTLNYSNPKRTLYAVWEIYKTYTLNYDANGGSGGPDSQVVSTTLDYYEFTIPTSKPKWKHKTFLGWSFDSGATEPAYLPGETVTLYSTKPTDTLYAVWDDQVHITFTCLPSEVGYVSQTVPVVPITELWVDKGELVNFTAYVYDGYEDFGFSSYVYNGEEHTVDSQHTRFYEDTKVYVYFKRVYSTITVTMDDAALLTNSIVSLIKGTEYIGTGKTVTARLKVGDRVHILYSRDGEEAVFLGWKKASSSYDIYSSDNPYYFNVSNPETYTASTYKHTGDTNNVECFPKVFNSSGSLVKDYDSGSFNFIIYEDTYTKWAEYNDMYGCEVPYGKDTGKYYTCEVYAVARDGYEFVRWEDDSAGTLPNPRSFESTYWHEKGFKYSAIFEKKEEPEPEPTEYATITVEVSPSTKYGMVTIDDQPVSSKRVKIGTTVTLKTYGVSPPGTHFVKWNDGNTDINRQVVVNEDITYTAIFALNEGNAVILMACVLVLSEGDKDNSKTIAENIAKLGVKIIKALK